MTRRLAYLRARSAFWVQNTGKDVAAVDVFMIAFLGLVLFIPMAGLLVYFLVVAWPHSSIGFGLAALVLGLPTIGTRWFLNHWAQAPICSYCTSASTERFDTLWVCSPHGVILRRALAELTDLGSVAT